MPSNTVQEIPVAQAFRLKDRIRRATLPQTELHDDGSTTLYIPIVRVERYSTLPQATKARRRWFFLPRGTSGSEGDHLAGRLNVRRVKRRSLHRM